MRRTAGLAAAFLIGALPGFARTVQGEAAHRKSAAFGVAVNCPFHADPLVIFPFVGQAFGKVGFKAVAQTGDVLTVRFLPQFDEGAACVV